jgi:hypothetical protein
MRPVTVPLEEGVHVFVERLHGLGMRFLNPKICRFSSDKNLGYLGIYMDLPDFHHQTLGLDKAKLGKYGLTWICWEIYGTPWVFVSKYRVLLWIWVSHHESRCIEIKFLRI